MRDVGKKIQKKIEAILKLVKARSEGVKLEVDIPSEGMEQQPTDGPQGMPQGMPVAPQGMPGMPGMGMLPGMGNSPTSGNTSGMGMPGMGEFAAMTMQNPTVDSGMVPPPMPDKLEGTEETTEELLSDDARSIMEDEIKSHINKFISQEMKR